MNKQNTIKISVAVFLAIIAGGAVWGLVSKHHPSPVMDNMPMTRKYADAQGDTDAESSTDMKVQPTISVSPPESERTQSQYAPPRKLPESLQEFYDLNSRKQTQLVREFMKDNTLPKDVLAFFAAEIINPKLNRNVRNEMANALVYQRTPDPSLHELFIPMLLNEDEDLVWRDFCIQFLGAMGPSTAEPDEIAKVLLKFTEEPGRLSATAMNSFVIFRPYIQDKAISRQYTCVVEKIASSKDRSVGVRVTALATIGQCGCADSLPVLRELLATESVSIKRAAAAAIGLLGDHEDVNALQELLAHPSNTVRLSAEFAIARLEKR